MAKQSLELRIEFSSSSEQNIEMRKLELLASIASVIRTVQENSRKGDSTNSYSNIVTLKSSFASNLDLFTELPNSLEKRETQFNTKEN
jgi:hypothetical protein